MKFFSIKRICLLGVVWTALLFIFFYQATTSTVAGWAFQLYATAQWGKPFTYSKIVLNGSKLMILDPSYDHHFSFSARTLTFDFSFNWNQYHLDVAVDVDSPNFSLRTPFSPQKELKSLFHREKKWFRAHPRFRIQKGDLSWGLSDKRRYQMCFDYISGDAGSGVLNLYFDRDNVETNYISVVTSLDGKEKKMLCNCVQPSLQSIYRFLELIGLYSDTLAIETGVLNGQLEVVFPSKGGTYVDANLNIEDFTYKYSSDRINVDGEIPQIKFVIKRDSLSEQNRELRLPFIGELSIPSQGFHLKLSQRPHGFKHLDIKLDRLNPNEGQLLQTLFSHFYPAISPLQRGDFYKGMINASIQAIVKETYQDHLLSFTYEVENLIFENNDFSIEIGKGEGPLEQRQGHLEIDLATYSHRGRWPIFHGAYLMKSNGLLFEEIQGTVIFEDHLITIRPLEGYCIETYFSGHLLIDYKTPTPGVFNLAIHLPVLSSKLSQIERFFKFFNKESSFGKIPFESVVTARNQGIVIDFAFTPQGCQIHTDIQGAVIDGYSTLENSNASIKGVYADFEYHPQSNAIDFTDIQGTLLLGKPRHVEEFLFVGDHLRIESLDHPDLHFDLTVFDGTEELFRFVGRSVDDAATPYKRVVLDPHLSHFSCIYPQEWDCTLKDWNSIESFQLLSHFDIHTLVEDLYRFRCGGLICLSPSILERLYHESTLEGIGTLRLGYEPLGHHFNYSLEAISRGNDGHDYPFAKLIGRKFEKKWIIDQLQWNGWTAYAELSHEDERWKVPFLGLHGGEDILVGLEGEFNPEEEMFNAKVNFCKIDLAYLRKWPFFHPYLDRWGPRGILRLSGQLSWNLLKGGSDDLFNGKFLIEGENIFIKDSPISVKTPIQMGVRIDEGELRLTLQKDRYGSLRGSTPWPSCSPITLTLKDHSSDYAEPFYKPLEITCGRNFRGDFSIQSMYGSFWGCDFNLGEDTWSLNQIQSQTDYLTSLVGDFTLDMHRLSSLIESSVIEMLKHFTALSTYTFMGRLTLLNEVNASFLDSCYFNGEFVADEPILKGYQFQKLHGKLQYQPHRIEIQDLKIVDPACHIRVDAVSIARESFRADWRFFIPKILVKDLFPGAVRDVMPEIDVGSTKWDALVVKSIELTELSGECCQINSWQGQGNIHFVNRVKKNFNHPIFAIPAELFLRLGLDPKVMNPVTGTIFFDLMGDRFYLRRFKDVYSEGRGSKFVLVSGTPSWMDMDGNLFVRIKMKQYNLLFKITEFFTVLVQGNIKNPQYQLLKENRGR